VTFSPDIIKSIRSGRRSQFRVPVIPGKDCRFKPGKAPLVKRTADSELRITITEVRQERLGDISLRDVKAEGWHTTAEFREDWIERYGEHDADQLVHVVSFIKGTHTDEPRIPAARPGAVAWTAKKGERWKMARGEGHGDYVSTASQGLTGCDEEVRPEVLAIYQARSSEGLRTQRNGRLSAQCERLRAAIAEIRRFAPDPSLVNKQLRSLEHQLASLERRLAA
jgi:hypothetical protein